VASIVGPPVLVEVVVIDEAVVVVLLSPPVLLPVDVDDVVLPPVPPALVVSPDDDDVVSLWQPASEDQTASIPVIALMPRNIILPLRTMRLLQECRERKASAAVMAANARPPPSSAGFS